MVVWVNLTLLRPIALIILVALRTTKAAVPHDRPPISLNAPQVIERTEQPVVTLKPGTKNGPPPASNNWYLLNTNERLHYTPTESNITLQITPKNLRGRGLNQDQIHSLTVLSLAQLASAAAATDGDANMLLVSPQSSIFATSSPTASQPVHFVMTATGSLPIYVVADALRAVQELTHYLYIQELVFDVFTNASAASAPIATGCLAFDCGSQTADVTSRDLELANTSATNTSAVAPSRKLQSIGAPVQLMPVDQIKEADVAYDVLKDALPISGQSFADVADRILADITDLIVANRGDDLLPLQGKGNKRLFSYEDTWGSNLGISLLPYGLPGVNFTLSQAAMALKNTQDKMDQGSLVESKLKITVDGEMVGWGCLRYRNTSAWRCIMPTPGSGSGIGSQSIAGAANDVPDPNATS